MKKLKNLQFPISEIIKDIDAVILSYTHGDHWDYIAAKNIPKQTPIFVQNNSDKDLLKSQGFTDVRIVELETQFNGITITKTEAKHGTDDVLTHFGANFGISMGFIFRAQGEKTVYFTGDTI